MFFRKHSLLFLFAVTTTASKSAAAELRGSIQRQLQGCKNTAAWAGQDAGCSPDKPLCVGASGMEVGFHAPGTKCVPCRNTQPQDYKDEGCSDASPRCLLANGSEPATQSGGDKCGQLESAASAAGCKNTAAWAGQDNGCSSDKPLCVDAAGMEVGFHAPGAKCVLCRNTQQEDFKDEGCSDENPRCLLSGGNEPAVLTAGDKCGPGSSGCVNTAAWGEQDKGCSLELPICVDSSGGELPSQVQGEFCALCLNTYQGFSRDAVDIGCSKEAPFCINTDKSEPDLNTAGQTCAVNHPEDEDKDEQLSATAPEKEESIQRSQEVPPKPIKEDSIEAPEESEKEESTPESKEDVSAEESEDKIISKEEDSATRSESEDEEAASQDSEDELADKQYAPAPEKREIELVFDKGLPCELGLTFNPPNAEYPQMIDNGKDKCILRMTPDAGAMMAASAFTTHTFDNEAKFGFSMSLGYRIYGPNAGSADGMAFVMHQDFRGEKALGGGGGYMGVYDGKGALGISPALVIEFDTFPNPGELKDDGENNIHITTISVEGHVTEIAESKGLDIRTPNDGSAGKLWVEYCDFDKVIRVFINNEGEDKPGTELLTAYVDLNKIFEGSTVTLGYTAAVGGQGDYHDITSWSFDEQCTIPPPAEEEEKQPEQIQSRTEEIKLEFDEGLPCELGLTFNPANAEYPQMIDNGNKDKCILRMTPDAGAYTAASAFTTHTFEDALDLAFSMSLGYRIYGPNAGSADGVAFVMHQDPRGENALGGGGGLMGVYESSDAKGIYPALVIEFDTYPNAGALMDNGENNIHVLVVDEDGKKTELGESSGVDIRTPEDGSDGKLWVEYCSDKVIRVFLNNQGTTKPARELMSVYVDLDPLFEGGTVTLGYTSAVGGQGDYHDITSWSFQEQCSIPEEAQGWRL